MCFWGNVPKIGHLHTNREFENSVFIWKWFFFVLLIRNLNFITVQYFWEVHSKTGAERRKVRSQTKGFNINYTICVTTSKIILLHVQFLSEIEKEGSKSINAFRSQCFFSLSNKKYKYSTVLSQHVNLPERKFIVWRCKTFWEVRSVGAN